LLVGQAEALAMSARISEDNRYLISGLRSYSVGNRPARDEMGREMRSRLLSESANFYCLPALIRERVAAVLTAHNFAT
jgi:hypothetical protein